jgi:hypothetical protein
MKQASQGRVGFRASEKRAADPPTRREELSAPAAPAAPAAPHGGSMLQQPAAEAAAAAAASLSSPEGEAVPMNDADTDGDGASGGPFVGAAIRLWHVDDAFDAA